jgi:Mn2+/Fe2+ NRAMP family transporter
MTDDSASGRKLDYHLAVDDDQGHKARWKVIGPGLVVAATGVGAGDLVATLVAGSRYG